MRSVSFYLVGFIALAAFQRFCIEGHEHRQARRGTVKVPWTGYLMITFHSLTYVFTVIEFFLRRERALLNSVASGIGIGMFLIGFMLRRWAIRTLGRYWSLQIEIRPGQPLIREGPYRFMRHPNYLALFLEVLGLPLLGNAYWTLLFVLWCYCPLIILRIVSEERALVEAFPQAYPQYQRECGALLPRVFTKRAAQHAQD